MDEIDNTSPDDIENQQFADDAVPVCPNCLIPCDPLINYCSHCGGNDPVNPLASYMPFVDIRFTVGMIGKLWRKAWYSDDVLILRFGYIFLLLFFYPLLVLTLPFVIYDKIKISRTKTPTS